MIAAPTAIAGHLTRLRHLAWSGFRGLRRRKAPFIPLSVLVLMALMGAFGPIAAPHDPTTGSLLTSLTPPIWLEGGLIDHPLGTDFQGRDVLSRILSGAQITIMSAAIGLVGAALVGVTLGLVSGYFGSWVDAILMRLVDFMLALPGLLFAMVMVAGLGASVRTIVIVVVATSWVAYARYVRGEVLSQRERDYVTAALVTGCSGVRIMLRHLLPNVLATVLVIATLQTGGIILLVASLSFLGLGIPKPTAAWGVMIADGRAWLLQAWWISVFPGVAISLLIISLNLVGDWMRDTFDPRLRGAE
jgi:peptide/nickel transport system permease protein